MSVFKQIIQITAVAFILALLSYGLHPNAPVWEQVGEWEMSLDAALSYKGNKIWVDVRGEDDYEQGHIPGALLLSEDDWDKYIENILMRWEPDVRLIVYCGSLGCGKSEYVATRLREEFGIEQAYVLKGGWKSWLKRQ